MMQQVPKASLIITKPTPLLGRAAISKPGMNAAAAARQGLSIRLALKIREVADDA